MANAVRGGLVGLFRATPEFLSDRKIHQIIAFAGDGKLKDGSQASHELRDYLGQVRSETLEQYVQQCLREPFTDSGLALQDLVNQIGQRLGFVVTNGRYRGTSNSIGYDGIWRLPDGHHIVIEVKTTDSYRIKLDTIAGYQDRLCECGAIPESVTSSTLLIVGRKDTGGLEAQIRGSRYAWSMRLISVEALLRLLKLKESVEDPTTLAQIHGILVPREYTRLDEIIEVLFATAEEVTEPDGQETDGDTDPDIEPQIIERADFRRQCIERLESVLALRLVKASRATLRSADSTTGVVCAISKTHKVGNVTSFWFAFHPHQQSFLDRFQTGWVAFGCGSPEVIVVVPIEVFHKWLPYLNMTKAKDRPYWHVRILPRNGKYFLHCKGDLQDIDLTEYVR